MDELSDKELRLSKSEIYRSFIKRRSRRSWSLVSSLIGLVVTFLIATVFTPELVNQPIIRGSMITLGISAAFIIIITMVLAAIYYVRWNNVELDRLLDDIRKQVTG